MTIEEIRMVLSGLTLPYGFIYIRCRSWDDRWLKISVQQPKIANTYSDVREEIDAGLDFNVPYPQTVDQLVLWFIAGVSAMAMHEVIEMVSDGGKDFFDPHPFGIVGSEQSDLWVLHLVESFKMVEFLAVVGMPHG